MSFEIFRQIAIAYGIEHLVDRVLGLRGRGVRSGFPLPNDQTAERGYKHERRRAVPSFLIVFAKDRQVEIAVLVHKNFADARQHLLERFHV